MNKLLFIILLLCTIQLRAQDGPTAGSALRSLSGVDMISGKVINVVFREAKEYTLFHFWKSESDSCIKQFPALVTLIKDYESKITVYGFPYEYKQQIASAKAMTAKYKLNWAHLLQYRQTNPEGANVIDVLKIDEFPTYMLLDKEGMILVRSGSLEDVQVVLKRLE
jgi:thiol-disulfide isomerase/thioredoxin